MGNEGNKSAKSKSKKGSTKAPWIKLEDKEKHGISLYLKKFLGDNNEFRSQKFISTIFTNISKEVSSNINNFLNSYYAQVKSSKKLQQGQNLDGIDIMTLAQILIKSTMDSDEDIYYHKKMILILYDLIQGEILYHEKDKDNLKIDDIVKAFNFSILIYFNKYAKKSSTLSLDPKEIFNDEFNSNIKEFILCNILNKYKLEKNDFSTPITVDQLTEFIDRKLPSLDGFIISYFSTYLFNLENDPNNENMTCFPIFNDPPSTLSIAKFFFYCLSNTIISSKHYAFKLYDCKVNGYNLSNLVYSFLGFTGPIIILVQHHDKANDNFITFGMFINKNFKECFSNSCGDDLSHILILGDKMDIFKTVGDDHEHYCFISSKNQKFQKHEPGIGMGYSHGQIRFWLDANELFSKSYFGKYDDVYEEGSPFEEMEEKLEICNLEVYGFGDDDTLKDLIKKQERDQVIINKMKKVDKSAFANNEFDREMFLNKTFSHRQVVDERAQNDLIKKDAKAQGEDN